MGLPLDHLEAVLSEDLDGEVFAVGFQPREQLRHNARPTEGPEDVALLVDTGLIEEADVLELNLVAVDARDLGDVGDDATAVAQPGLLYQQGDGAHDLFADGPV